MNYVPPEHVKSNIADLYENILAHTLINRC